MRKRKAYIMQVSDNKILKGDHDFAIKMIADHFKASPHTIQKNLLRYVLVAESGLSVRMTIRDEAIPLKRYKNEIYNIKYDLKFKKNSDDPHIYLERDLKEMQQIFCIVSQGTGIGVSLLKSNLFIFFDIYKDFNRTTLFFKGTWQEGIDQKGGINHGSDF